MMPGSLPEMKEMEEEEPEGESDEPEDELTYRQGEEG
jgi:hypothetical protein